MNRGSPRQCAYVEGFSREMQGARKYTPLLLPRARWSLPSSQSKQIHQQNVPGRIVPTQPRQLVGMSISLLTPPVGEDNTLCLALEGEKNQDLGLPVLLSAMLKSSNSIGKTKWH